ncbi:MAG: hypothetical protein Kow0098_07010 [Ignavibacteriaceae bacterium]
MGKIIYWTLIRLALTIPLVWIAEEYIETGFYWLISVFFIYLIVLHPAFVQYSRFREENKNILEDTICSKCKHFDETAVLCMLYDKHPTEKYIPCEGTRWEPKE